MINREGKKNPDSRHYQDLEDVRALLLDDITKVTQLDVSTQVFAIIFT